MEWLAQMVQEVLVRWGYLALAGGLAGESAGIPLPGETILMYSSFVAHKTGQLNIFLVIIIGTAAAVVGDNIGYWVGRRLGPSMLKWLDRHFHMEEDIVTARNQLKRHGAITIFWARYIFGLRTIAGPVAGTLEMEWKTFLLANLLGAATWVTSVSLAAYFLAAKMNSLAGFIEKASWGISGSLFLAGYVFWRHKKKQVMSGKQAERCSPADC
jgi:membrane protein DedA with SNARE-associated domain